MSVLISWAPSPESDIASYDVEQATSASGTFAFLVNIPHNLAGANYDTATDKFFYADGAGTVSNWYRLITVDDVNNRSAPSAAFQPATGTPTFVASVSVDQNYGAPGALRYQTQAGAPIEGALIRLYKKTDFDQGNTGAAVAVTSTDVHGNWVNPVALSSGFTYVVQFFKEGLYGPDKIEIVV